MRDLVIYEKLKPTKYKNTIWVEIGEEMHADGNMLNKYYSNTWSAKFLDTWPAEIKHQAI